MKNQINTCTRLLMYGFILFTFISNYKLSKSCEGVNFSQLFLFSNPQGSALSFFRMNSRTFCTMLKIS